MATTTKTFAYTGGPQLFTVPAGITSLTVNLYGGATSTLKTGGFNPVRGGQVSGTIAVNPGEVYYIYVGQSFATSPILKPGAAPTPGGYNGGGTGSYGSGNQPLGSPGGPGAGRTDIRGPNANGKANIKACAGGSGGYGAGAAAGTTYAGGLAGTVAGSPGNGPAPGAGGKGGTQTASGYGGSPGAYWNNGQSGSTAGQGGNAARYNYVLLNGQIQGSGGGGGGWFAGGGGAAYQATTGTTKISGASGGGGSNFVGGMSSVTANNAGYVDTANTGTSSLVTITYNAVTTTPPDVPGAYTVPSNGQATLVSAGNVLSVAMQYTDPNGNNGNGILWWGTDPTFGVYSTVTLSTVASGANSVGSITLPTSNTTYYFKFFAHNQVNGITSAAYSGFFYSLRDPLLSTGFQPANGASFLTNTTAILKFTVYDQDGQGVVGAIQYTTDPNFVTGVSTVFGASTVFSGQTATVNLYGLAQGTTYYWRGAGRSTTTGPFGPIQTFTTNRTPNAPTISLPVNKLTINYAIPESFAWVFSDPDPADYQSSADIQYRVGAGAWTLISGIATTATTWSAPANTFTGSNYEYQIRTTDSAGNVSPWSVSAFFNGATTPGSATITTPASGAYVTTNPITVSWTTPNPQYSYRIQVFGDTLGAPDPNKPVSDTGYVISTQQTNTTILISQQQYPNQWIVLTWQQYPGIDSAVDNQSFSALVPGPQPLICTGITNTDALTNTLYFQAIPYGQPAVVMRIYRDDQLGSGPILVYNGVPVANWTDYFPALNVNYAYTVQQDSAIGGTTSQELLPYSQIINQDITLGAANYWTTYSGYYSYTAALLLDPSGTSYGNILDCNFPNSTGPTNFLPVYNPALLPASKAYFVPITVGISYEFSISMKNISGNAGTIVASACIDWLDSSGSVLSTSQGGGVPTYPYTTGVWNSASVIATAPLGAAYASPRVQVNDYLYSGSSPAPVANNEFYLALPTFSYAVGN